MSLCNVNLAIAQRYDDTRTYDIIGLPDGDEVIECLTMGIPVLLAGLILLFLLSKFSDKNKDENNNSGWWCGCLSVILIGISIFIMLPLFSWIEAIVVSIVSIVCILGIIVLIFGWLTGKL